MSSVKGCKRCSYKTIYNIDYELSAEEQMVYYTTDKVCSKCNYNPESKRKYDIFDKEYCVIPLDKVTDDMNVDLSKIIHEHNHNKYRYTEYKTEYDKDICIKLILIKYYECETFSPLDEEELEKEEFKEYKDIYDKIEYEIDYKISTQKQKICYKEIKTCSKSKRIKPRYEYKEIELNNYPNDINVDLTKITIHKHNHDKVDYYKVPQYNYGGKCIELILYTYYYCSICDKEMLDKKEIYNFNNPCKMMDELTKEQQKYNYCEEYIKQMNIRTKEADKHISDYERRKEARHEGDLDRYCEWWRNNHHDCGCYNSDYESGASYDSKGGHYYSYHGEWISGY